MTSTLRLFVALLPDQTVCTKLASWRDAWTWPRAASPVDSARLHVTLHFLGPVPSERLPDLVKALQVPFAPFTLRLLHTSLWQYGIAVLEPESPPAALVQLHESTASVLKQLQLPVDQRPFRPHVTLARRAKGARLCGEPVPVEWYVDRYTLMSSAAAPGGGYSVVQAYAADLGSPTERHGD